MIDGEPWFVLRDICELLDLTTPARVAERLTQKGVSKTHTPTRGGSQPVTIINEPNLYRVVLRSNSPAAAPFEAWVTEQVLPAIRKTGAYGADAALRIPRRMRVGIQTRRPPPPVPAGH